MSVNSFQSRSSLRVGGKDYEIYRLDALDQQGISTQHLPYSLRILLENLLRTEDGRNVLAEDIRALAAWSGKAKYVQIDPTPTRVGWHVPAEVAVVGDPKLVLRQIIDEDPPLASALDNTIPPELETIVMKAIALPESAFQGR